MTFGGFIVRVGVIGVGVIRVGVIRVVGCLVELLTGVGEGTSSSLRV